MRPVIFLLLLIGCVAGLSVGGCDGPSPVAPEQAAGESATPLFKVPDNPTPCYTAGMAVEEATKLYAEAAKSLAKCDQNGGPCEVEVQAHADAWLGLTAAHGNAEAQCGDGPPPAGNQPPVAGASVIPAVTAAPRSTLVCDHPGFVDPDGDPLQYTYRWYRELYEIDYATEAQLALDVMPGGGALLVYAPGTELQCSVEASDGEFSTGEVRSNVVQIADLPAPQVSRLSGAWYAEGGYYKLLLDVTGTDFIPDYEYEGGSFVEFSGPNCNINSQEISVWDRDFMQVTGFSWLPENECLFTLTTDLSPYSETCAGLIVTSYPSEPVAINVSCE